MNLAHESCSQLISGSINAKEIKPTQKSQVPPVYKFQAGDYSALVTLTIYICILVYVI